MIMSMKLAPLYSFDNVMFTCQCWEACGSPARFILKCKQLLYGIDVCGFASKEVQIRDNQYTCTMCTDAACDLEGVQMYFVMDSLPATALPSLASLPATTLTNPWS
jgi:hypothetical protein